MGRICGHDPGHKLRIEPSIVARQAVKSRCLARTGGEKLSLPQEKRPGIGSDWSRSMTGAASAAGERRERNTEADITEADAGPVPVAAGDASPAGPAAPGTTTNYMAFTA